MWRRYSNLANKQTVFVTDVWGSNQWGTKKEFVTECKYLHPKFT